MLKLTWSDLLIDDIAPDDFWSVLQPWAPVITGSVGLAFMNKFGAWFLRRPEGPVVHQEGKVPGPGQCAGVGEPTGDHPVPDPRSGRERRPAG